MKNRNGSAHIRILSLGTAAVLSASMFYLFIVLRTGHGIPCIFYHFLGMKCPGCGLTRSAVSILKGDLRSAAHYNLMSVTVIPSLIAYLAYRAFREECMNNKDVSAWEFVYFILVFFVTALYTVIRNISTFIF
ncbi:DUF2752 domain-containing protein [Ruminococcus sp. HUN007]|uniref:DUF2752 domain-containing protein n=1 Tax=Ruminococcus sp. HUN007 TaxID=1514668 RepID=UPI0006787B04|nr:DUF2752 domain-containing protein [Ruminococcus sp. HUN007]